LKPFWPSTKWKYEINKTKNNNNNNSLEEEELEPEAARNSQERWSILSDKRKKDYLIPLTNQKNQRCWRVTTRNDNRLEPIRVHYDIGGTPCYSNEDIFHAIQNPKERIFGNAYHILKPKNFYWGKQSIKLSNEEELKYPILRQYEKNQTKNNNNNNNNSLEEEEELEPETARNSQEQKMEEDRI